MKKSKYILGFLIINILLITVVFAAQGDVTFKSIKSVVSPGDTASFLISIDAGDQYLTEFKITGIEYNDKVLTPGSSKAQGDFSGPGKVSEEMKFSLEEAKTGKLDVAQLDFIVDKDTSAKSEEIKIHYKYSYKESLESSDEIETGDVDKKVSISIKSKVKTLNKIEINGEKLEGFSPTKYQYSLELESSINKVTLEASLTDSSASFKNNLGPRTFELDYGENVVTLNVLSEIGEEQIYKINITREDDRGTDNYLKSITIDGEKLQKFKSKTLSYEYYTFKADTVSIEAETVDDNASYEVEGPKDLKIGDNEFTLVVSSESGETLDYFLKIINIDRDISKKLRTLSIKGYQIDFDKNTNRYEILYDKKLISNIKITYLTEEDDDFVSVTISPNIETAEERKKLRAGDEITITVTGIDGESSEYTIVLKKDTRVNFFFILGFLILGILAFVFWKLKKTNKKDPKKNEKNDKAQRRSKEDSKEIEYEEKPKKKRRFSIYEDEYEAVEVPVTDEIKIPEGLDRTKEISTRELRLRNRL